MLNSNEHILSDAHKILNIEIYIFSCFKNLVVGFILLINVYTPVNSWYFSIYNYHYPNKIKQI